MGPGVRHLTFHPGTPASWAVLDAARRHGWWDAGDIGSEAGSGALPDPDEVDRLIARLGVARPGPESLGLIYEALLHPDERSAGAHYTPADVARRLAAEAVGVIGTPGHDPVRVWDPTCGGGAFLLAAADALHRNGHDPAAVVNEMLWGTDIDPGAIAVSAAALRWWAETHGATAAEPGRRLTVADVFVSGCPVPEGCDVVIGNPPFQGQLRGGSVRTPAQTKRLRELWGDAVGPYTDTAALALVVGAAALRPGGRLAMVMPLSVLGARDAVAARDAATGEARLVGLWVAAEPVFAAEVDVCAVLLAFVEHPSPVRRWRGRAFDALADAEAPEPGQTWAPLAAAALGVPEPVVSVNGRVGDIAEVSAGFRDEYYGLVGHVKDAPPGFRPDERDRPEVDEASTGLAPLITSGLIEPGRVTWGENAVRFAKVDYDRPVVELGSLHRTDGRASRRVAALAVPKVLIATQTKVGEAAVDEHGRWVASTPIVTAVAPADLLWKLAAVVCSPVGSALAAARTAGTGRATRAIKHSVTSVRDLPLPIDDQAWSVGAEALRLGDQQAFAAAMSEAYRVVDPTEVERWWTERAPWSR